MVVFKRAQRAQGGRPKVIQKNLNQLGLDKLEKEFATAKKERMKKHGH